MQNSYMPRVMIYRTSSCFCMFHRHNLRAFLRTGQVLSRLSLLSTYTCVACMIVHLELYAWVATIIHLNKLYPSILEHEMSQRRIHGRRIFSILLRFFYSLNRIWGIIQHFSQQVFDCVHCLFSISELKYKIHSSLCSIEKSWRKILLS